MVSGNRLRHTSAGLERIAILCAAVLRSAESAYRAAPAATGWLNRTQDGRRCDGRGLQRHPDERALRHLGERRLENRALLLKHCGHSHLTGHWSLHDSERLLAR